MGLCLGCCPRDSDNESIGPDGDRSRLINGEVLPNDSTHFRDSDEENDDFPYGSLGDNNRHIGGGIQCSGSLTKNKINAEQEALAQVVHDMATDIIDVNLAHHTVTLEPAELQERAYEYGRRLQLASNRLAQKYAYLRSGQNPKGFEDAGQQADKILQSEILSTSDTMLINEIAARAREASGEFQIEHVPYLVGMFGQIRKRFEPQSLESAEEHDSKPHSDDNSESDEESS